MLLTSIIVKVLAIVDVYLGYFATAATVNTTNICGTIWTTYSGTLTSCGQEQILADLMEDLFELHSIIDVLPALFAV